MSDADTWPRNLPKAGDQHRPLPPLLGNEMNTIDPAVLNGIRLMLKITREYYDAVRNIFALRHDGKPYNERDLTKDTEALLAFQALNDASVRLRAVTVLVEAALPPLPPLEEKAQ